MGKLLMKKTMKTKINKSQEVARSIADFTNRVEDLVRSVKKKVRKPKKTK